MPLTRQLGRLLQGLMPGSGQGNDPWPFLRGDYRVVDATGSVVVVTLSNSRLAADIAALATPGLCMTYSMAGTASEVGTLARTLIANLSIQWLLLVGEDENKRLSGLQALFNGDADEAAHALGRARIKTAQVTALRKQVQLEDQLGRSDLDKIVAKIRDLSAEANRPETGFVAPQNDGGEQSVRVIAADTITHENELDKAGSFKIRLEKDRILAEQYDQKENLLRVIEGTTARSICLTLVRNGWVSKLDHAAYLGRQLARAEAALIENRSFEQDASQGARQD